MAVNKMKKVISKTSVKNPKGTKISKKSVVKNAKKVSKAPKGKKSY